jgi:cysteine-rich repeat protein
MTKTAAALGVLLAAVAAGRTLLPPYDFTGHWEGTILAAGQVLPVSADFTATSAKSFKGSATADGVPCTVRGKRKQSVSIRLKCPKAKVKLVGALDIENDRVSGDARISRKRQHFRGVFGLERPVCGNGALESGEQCDDGNTVDGDGCSATCMVEAMCGNGTLEPGERCDDGNTVGGDGCSATCTAEVTNQVTEVEPNDVPAQGNEAGSLPVLAHGAIDPGGDLDFFRVVIGGSDLYLETFDGNGQGSCAAGTDTFLELRGADGNTIIEVDDDGGIAPCSKLDLHGLTPGVYFVCVRGVFLSTLIPAYTVLMIGS